MILRLLFVLLLSINYLHSSLILDDSKNKFKNFSIHYYYDETDLLTIDEISQKSFIDKIDSQFTLGYKNKNIWFKIEIKNKSAVDEFVLYFTEPFWDKLDLYEKQQDGWKVQKSGLLIPLEKRSINDSFPAFPINIDTNEDKVFYINGKTVNGLIGAFEVFEHDEYFKPSRITIATFYQLYTAVLIMIVIINLYLLYTMRENIYAYYIGYVISYILFISMFGASYLHFGFSGWSHGLHTIGSVVFIFMALFSMAFFELDKYMPKISKIFKLYPFAFFMFAVLMGFGIPYFTLLFNVVAFTFMMSILVIGIKTWKIGKIKTKFYLIAIIVFMPTMGMMALAFDSMLINTDFTRYSFLIGALVEVIFFSLILFTRYHYSKYDQIRLQKKLLEEKEKYEIQLKAEIEKQRLELEEKSAMMLEQSQHAQMGEMISMIAHQWRQPLGAISVTAIDAKMKSELEFFDLNNSKEVKEYESYINESLDKVGELAQNLTNTIDDFRNFYKPNKELESISLKCLVDKSLSIIKPYIINDNIKVSEDYKCDSKVNVYGNEIMQVILNILKNAQDNFKEKNIENPSIDIKALETDKSHIIEISDNGGGIEKDNLKRIFEPYFSTKTEKNGTGLGLYMSKLIIEEHHNGNLNVENIDNGVKFSIVINK